ncbi:aldo/keto reductase [Mucisphaera calidilacus]|uniref:1,5-anhydro-D-fructose reductase n=1 Tax=Mucisphaera calidilacus TaxID=2527982 RepID=A0A518BVE2_9BACT|nr:aldo/keto reductase [Mucisphaera calidilacus]QDU70953.1 1,5-anhydro-D-fructose reductase [Mucisphaera calidilacus]
MSQTVRWGIIGTGAIAEAMAGAITTVANATLAAVASRDRDRAASFINQLGLASVRANGSYDDLLADPEVDAVYIATPHPLHAQLSIEAAEAGKHILCEKPAALNLGELMPVIAAVRAYEVFYMEAFKDRCHPQTHKLVELIKGGAIGELRHARAAFGFNTGPNPDPDGRLLNPELGGGGILDVGCYPIHLLRLVAGVATGRSFADPDRVVGDGHLGHTGVDVVASALLKFDSGFVAEASTAINAHLDNRAIIAGTRGTITLPNPWLNSRGEPDHAQLILEAEGKTQTVDCPSELNSFGYEIGEASRAILAGEKESPAMSWNDSLGQARTLDLWRRTIRLRYPSESPERFQTPRSRKRPQSRTTPRISQAEIPGLSRPVTRLVMGCDNQINYPHAAAMFDHYLDAGGNTFDTAHIYDGGRQEQLLGHWINARGVRDRVNVIVKVAHTPYCDPDSIKSQFAVSLDRMGLDKADLLLLHRDNPGIPVDEFVDVLHELVEDGRVSVFGGSNWSLGRFNDANAYAAANQRHRFSILSNNFSLARMVRPVWDGCISVSDPESRATLVENQIPNLAWSSQARGYFVTPGGTDNHLWQENDAWDAPDNRTRRERAFELAGRHNVSAINIAAAYVLTQPFPSFALIGPRNLDELETTLPALSVELTDTERAYLNLETDEFS